MTKCLRNRGEGMLYDRQGTGDNNYNKIYNVAKGCSHRKLRNSR